MTAQKLQAIDFVRPYLYPKQKAAFYTTARYSLTEASTKAGKTHGAIIWLTEMAVVNGFKGSNHWWVAPVSSQAEIAYRRIKNYVSPSWYISQGGEGNRRLYFPHNGATIWFKSGDKPDSLYGEDVHDMVADEASRHKEDSWHAMRSTITATKGRFRGIGNIKGRKNWYYKLCRMAQQGNDPDMEYHSINAYDAADAGVIPHAEIENARKMLPEHIFNELYLNKPSDDGGNPFGLKAIRECTLDDFSWNEPVVFGWDLAKSVDFTVGIGLDRQGVVCRFERFQHTWQGTRTQIKEVTGKTPCAIDATGVGDPIVEDIQRDLALIGNGNVEGFKFTSLSKQQLMEGLASAIQQKLIKFSGNDIIRELESFEYEITRTGVKYSAPEGLHDDCVCALALAWHKYKQLYSGAVVAPSIEWL